MMRRLAPLLLLVTACSPAVSFKGTVTVDGVESPDPARLHISLSTEAGEPEGRFTGIVGQDRGIFSGNTTKVPEMALAAEVPLAERHPDDQPKGN